MSHYTDTYKHKGLRKKLIQELRDKGIDRKDVLDALMEVPRHWFMDSAFLEFAYSDKAFPIAAGQTISQPYTVAFQSSLLDVEKGMKVLEIGTGSGYQAAVLAALGAKVYTVERQKALYRSAQTLLSKVNLSVKCFFGDGYKGLPAFAPFDRVLITCGAPFIPEELVRQLKPGGILVVPLGEGDVQEMTRLEKHADQSVTITRHGAFRFVPMLQDKEAS